MSKQRFFGAPSTPLLTDELRAQRAYDMASRHDTDMLRMKEDMEVMQRNFHSLLNFANNLAAQIDELRDELNKRR